MLTAFFPNRDCVTLKRPVENETLLQQLDLADWSTFRPEFVEQVETLRRKIYSSAPPKAVNGQILSGFMLSQLATEYAASINTGASLNIGDAWSQVSALSLSLSLSPLSLLSLSLSSLSLVSLSHTHTQSINLSLSRLSLVHSHSLSFFLWRLAQHRRGVIVLVGRLQCVLQCVIVCCSVLQHVAVCCSVLQCVAVCYNVSVPSSTSAMCIRTCRLPPVC